MSCDLCKKAYPYKFLLGETIIELIQIPKPPEKYIILEGLCKDKNASKWLHVISLNNKDSIKLGRANECELRMSDISVSRLHATIKLIGENFYLEDKGSKFGTLVQIKRPIALDTGYELNIQAGRTLLLISIKKPWSIIPACFKSSSSPFEFAFSPYPKDIIPLFPINSGIPLSIDDTEELLERAGINHRDKVRSKINDNLMFEHGQLGMNSSLEDEEFDGVANVQEIMAPDLEEEENEDIERQEIHDNHEEVPDSRERRSHSII